MQKVLNHHPALTMHLMTVLQHHSGFVTGHISQYRKWSCQGLNPQPFCLPDFIALTFNPVWSLHLLNKGAPYWMAMIQSNPLPRKVMLNGTQRERGWEQQKNKAAKVERRGLGQ